MFSKAQEIFDIIKTQRKRILAPVDKYGLVSIPKKYKLEEYRFLILISLLLSSQTKDEYTSESVDNFIKKEIFSFQTLSFYSINEIKSLIEKVGFANKKALFLFNLSQKYKNKNLPTNYDDVMKMEGIGSKMAYLYLQYGCDKVEGIGVDTHVLRMSNRLGFSDTKNPEVCRKNLESLFPKSLWNEINYVLVGFGQVICKAKSPQCSICDARHLCISSKFEDW